MEDKDLEAARKALDKAVEAAKGGKGGRQD